MPTWGRGGGKIIGQTGYACTRESPKVVRFVTTYQYQIFDTPQGSTVVDPRHSVTARVLLSVSRFSRGTIEFDRFHYSPISNSIFDHSMCGVRVGTKPFSALQLNISCTFECDKEPSRERAEKYADTAHISKAKMSEPLIEREKGRASDFYGSHESP